jgi:rod shape-determining protein MreC
MRGLIILLSRYGNTILFLLLEIICFYLVISYNKSQSAIYLNSVNILSGKLEEESNQWKEFLNLDILNDSLIQENARLKKMVVNLSFPQGITQAQLALGDSLMKYDIVPAKVINQSVHLRNNFITLDKGAKDGLTKRMGVIDKNGIVGIIDRVGKNYSRALSVLNNNCKISGSVKHKNYFGTLSWKTRTPQYLVLEDLPKHANIAIGDTIETSGYSTVFPPGILIGTIDNFELVQGSSFYKVRVKTNNDFASLHHVYVLKNLFRKEQLNLEEAF